MEDEDDAYFTEIAKHEPFRLGHIMNAIEIGEEDGHFGILVRVIEDGKAGKVPLADVEVTTKDNVNYWPVREYVVWMANRC